MEIVDHTNIIWTDTYMLRGKAVLTVHNVDTSPCIGEHVVINDLERKVTAIHHDMIRGTSLIFLS